MSQGMSAVISSIQCPRAHSSFHQLSSLELVRTEVYMSVLRHLRVWTCISTNLQIWGRDLVGQFGQASHLGMQVQI